jgi:hypothetical protein
MAKPLSQLLKFFIFTVVVHPPCSAANMSANQQLKLTRHGSVKPPKLTPRREFGPAQDWPLRRLSVRNSTEFEDENCAEKQRWKSSSKRRNVRSNSEQPSTTISKTLQNFDLLDGILNQKVRTYMCAKFFPGGRSVVFPIRY